MEYSSKPFEVVSWGNHETEIFKNFLKTCRNCELRHYGTEVASLDEKHTGVCYSFAPHMIENNPQSYGELFEIFFNNIRVEENGFLDRDAVREFRFLLRGVPFSESCPQSADPSRDYAFCDGSALHLANPGQVAFPADAY